MLTQEEEKFVKYWEENRQPHSSFASKLTRGLPVSMAFGLLIIIIVFFIQFLSPQWYTKASQATQQTENGQRIITKEFQNNPEWYNKVTQFSTGTFVAIILAVIIGILFFSYLRMHFKWEMNEQLYRELKQKEKRPDAANEALNNS